MNSTNNLSFIIDQAERISFDNFYFERLYKLDKNIYTDDKLYHFISEEIHNSIKKGESIPKCYFIEVDETDGMTWSLENLKNKFVNNYDQFYYRGIIDTKKNVGLPKITQIISEKVFKKLAVQSKIMPKFQKFSVLNILSKGFFSALIATAFILIKKTLENLAPHGFSEIPKLLSDPYFIFIFIICFIIGCYQPLRNLFRKITEKESINKLQENLLNEDYIYAKNKLIDKLSNRIIINYPCFLFIDNYENLDPLSQDVIQTYFRNSSSNNLGLAIWIIFQTSIKNTEKLYCKVDELAKSKIFTLKSLEFKEKEELTRALKLSSNYADYKTIKEICLGQSNEETIKNLVTQLREYSIKNPTGQDTATELDFLHLIALNSKPYNLFYSRDYYINSFKSGDRDYIRNIILRVVLKKIALTKAKLEPRFNIIYNELNFTIEKNNGEYRLIDRIDEAFKIIFLELKLPDPIFGHLFWSLFHGERFQMNMSQFMRTRVLNYHLLNTNYRAIESFEKDKDYEKILMNLYNHTITAINLSIKTCYTEGIIDLLRFSKSLLVNDILYSNTTIKNNFLKKAWQSYSLLFDNDILDIIFSILEECEIHSHEEESILDTIFFETISNPKIKESNYRLNLFCIHPDEYKNSKVISNYFRTLSAWFSISLFPTLTNGYEQLSLYSSAIYSFDYLKYTFKALERLTNTQEEEFKEIDFRTLSMSIWALSLKFKRNFKSDLLFSGNLMGFDHDSPDKLFLLMSKAHITEYDEFLLFIENVLLEITEYNSRITEIGIKKEVTYYYKGLIFELSTSSLASIVLPLKYLPSSLIDDYYVNRINKIVSILNKLVDIDIPIINHISKILEPSFINRIDDLFEFSTIIWERLGLTVINSQIAIRRLQFLLEFNQKEDELLNKLEDIKLPLNENGFLGLLCNVVLANGLNQIELKSYYFKRAVEIIFDNNFGKIIRREFSLILLNDLYESKDIFDRYFFEIEIASSNGFFSTFLANLSDDQYYKSLIHITNSLEKVESHRIKEMTFELLKKRKELIQNDYIKQESGNWFDIIELENNFRIGRNIQIDNILENWSERKDSWLFASVLAKCVKNGYCTNEIKLQAFYVLEHGMISPYIGNSFLILALEIISIPMTDQELRLPLKCLEEHIKYWENNIPIEFSIQVYEQLEYHKFGDLELYNEKLEKLKTEKWINDHFQKLPDLLKKGAYYILFKEYFNSLIRYGLPIDTDYAGLFRKLNVKQEEKTKYIYEWAKRGGEFPDIFVNELVNTDFIKIGDFLLSPELFSDPKYDNKREELNTHVAQKIDLLFDLIKSLDVPEYFLHTLDEFINKYYIPKQD